MRPVNSILFLFFLFGKVFGQGSADVSYNAGMVMEPNLLNQVGISGANKKRFAVSQRRSFSVSFFGEGLYVSETISPAWAHPNVGPGIRYGAGGGISVNYYFNRKAGITLEGGYSQYKVNKEYIYTDTEETILYTTREEVERIPVQIGLKIFPLKSIYIHLSGGGQLLKWNRDFSDFHPESSLFKSLSQFTLTTQGAVGYILYLESFFLDLAAIYSFSPVRRMENISEPLQTIGLKLGFGFHKQ